MMIQVKHVFESCYKESSKKGKSLFSWKNLDVLKFIENA